MNAVGSWLWQLPIEVKLLIIPRGHGKRFLPHGHFDVQFAGLGFGGLFGGMRQLFLCRQQQNTSRLVLSPLQLTGQACVSGRAEPSRRGSLGEGLWLLGPFLH